MSCFASSKAPGTWQGRHGCPPVQRRIRVLYKQNYRKERFMPNTNASFSPRMRSAELKQQIVKLEQLDHRTPVLPSLETFDAETEALLGRLYGAAHKYLEAYKYATVAEAEALVNLPESAQEPLAK